ncbi:MAG: AmmeMemoRadiSam system protein B [Oligoflexia bacterium]|nr:AmmeMemoRadiSam system protein B [Oligoflexia bacterium]
MHSLLPTISLLLIFLATGVRVMVNNDSTNPIEKSDKIVAITEGNRWYPEDRLNLKNLLQRYWENVSSATSASSNSKYRKIKAMISPHAGLQYSGATAAYGFYPLSKLADGGIKYERVIVIGPSHYYPLQNQLAHPVGTLYKTPLGNIAIDQQAIKQLTSLRPDLFTGDDTPFYREHSVDNQIPFIQYSLKYDFKIIPLIMGHSNLHTIKEMAKTLSLLMKNKGDNTLIIISSDFTHYGSNFGFTPFTKNVEENLKKLDYEVAQTIQNFALEKFYSFEQDKAQTVCGHGPITLLMAMSNAAETEVVINHYETSGRLSQDFSLSVSYFSILFFPKETAEYTLTDTEKKLLLKIARKNLEEKILRGKILSSKEVEKEFGKIPDNLLAKRGGFVTLNIGHDLRGCIGEIFPSRPLIDVVLARSIDSALNDTRFHPVKADELSEITIEISVLTPPRSVPSYNDIIIGKHGVVLTKGVHGAVFLPQVASEQGWDLPTTLAHLSQKAGLHPHAWREDTSFQVFEAIVFNEDGMK